MVRQAVRPLSTNGPTSEFVDQRSRTVAFSVSVPVDRVRRVPRVSRSPAHRSSSTTTPVSAGRGSRQKKRVSFGSCPGQRQLQLTMIKKLRPNGGPPLFFVAKSTMCADCGVGVGVVEGGGVGGGDFHSLPPR